MYPKTAGLAAVLSCLRGKRRAAHDITVAYKDYHEDCKTTLWSLLVGEFPREVHMIVRRYEIDRIFPEDGAVLKV